MFQIAEKLISDLEIFFFLEMIGFVLKGINFHSTRTRNSKHVLQQTRKIFFKKFKSAQGYMEREPVVSCPPEAVPEKVNTV